MNKAFLEAKKEEIKKSIEEAEKRLNALQQELLMYQGAYRYNEHLLEEAAKAEAASAEG